jgi:hypothetical protein
MLQDLFEVRAGEGHALAGQLLEAADLRQVGAEAERPEVAATVALFETSVVA